MPHDAAKVLLGATTSSTKTVTNELADPATFVAGLAVRRKTDGGLKTEDDATAALIGISLGRSSTDAGKTSVLRKGLGVPLRLKVAYETGVATIGTFSDMLDSPDFDSFTIGDTQFTAQSAAVTEGDATFQAAVSDEETASSLAAQINAHEDTMNLVTAVADGDEVTVTQKAIGDLATVFLFNDNTENAAGSVTGGGTLEDGIDSPAVIGGQVSVNDDGMGCADDAEDAAATGATYAGEVLAGVGAAGAFEAWVALVDIRGSL